MNYSHLAAIRDLSKGESSAEIKRLRDALEMLFTKYEDGDAVYENGDSLGVFCGRAVKLSQKESIEILSLIPKERTALAGKDGGK